MAVDFSGVGRALGSRARSAMVDLLMDGSSRPASELASVAEVTRSTASEHLRLLTEAGLVVVDVRGRQRRYRLSGPDIASALEQLGHLCPTTPVRSLRLSREQRELAAARLCYDHLAGGLGVAVTDAFVGRRWLRADTLDVTGRGREALSHDGIDVPALLSARRPTSRPCADWTERRPHLAGGLGAAVAAAALERTWVVRRSRGRGLDVTAAGRVGLGERWGVIL